MDDKTPMTDKDKYMLAVQAMRNERSSWDPHWAQLARYMLPRSGRFFASDRNNGESRHNNIYDNTATRSVRILGAGLMGGASSPTRPWIRLATEDKDLMNYEPVKVWLNEVTQIILGVFQRSNTYRSIHQMYEELGVFGTACSIMTDDFDRVIHQHTQTIGEYSLATNEKREVNAMSRELQMTVRQVVQRFGRDKCSQAVKNLYDRGNLNAWVDVIHIIEPRTDRKHNDPRAENKAYASVYFEPGEGGVDSSSFLRVSGFDDFRVLAPRWAVMSNDIYGSPCPGMEALGDTKQLQHEQLRKAECIDYQTKPPLQVPTKLQGRALDRLPGGISHYDQTTPQGGVRSLFEVNLDLNHLLADIQDVRGRINSAFYTDLFLMLSQAPTNGMTATEVVERHEEKLLMIGPVLERLHNELLDPLVSMTFTRLLNATGPNGQSMLPPPPEELEGVELKVEFVSMLAQAQKAINTNAMDRWSVGIGQLVGIKPDIADKINSDRYAEAYGDALGIDPELIVGAEEVGLIRKQRAEAQQAAEQQAAIAQSAETAQKLSQASTEGGNILSDIL